MGRTITLRYPGKCAGCGANLEKGARARYYGRGRVYGLDCHERGAAEDTGQHASRSAYERGDRSPGARASHYDRRGVYAADGAFLGTSGPRCEDAPCCGCCS